MKMNCANTSSPGSMTFPVEQDQSCLHLRGGNMKPQMAAVLYRFERQLEIPECRVDAARQHQTFRSAYKRSPLDLLLFHALQVERYALTCRRFLGVLVIGL